MESNTEKALMYMPTKIATQVGGSSERSREVELILTAKLELN